MEIYINPELSLQKSLTERPYEEDKGLEERVGAILSRVKLDGDKALAEMSLEFDGFVPESLECTEADCQEACDAVSDDVKKAIASAAANIRRFHEAQLPRTVDLETSPGVRCVQKALPIDCVGLYIPGGSAPLFSTVLMLALPAKVAGCREIVLCTPVSRKTGKVAPEVIYAARYCGVDRIFKVGGAQAIAAMAFGTESIPRVDKVFGPGNRYVTTAKQMLGNRCVAIDMPAGPSEVMVLADSSARADFVASDLLSQAEHGPDSQVMLVCDSADIAAAVGRELDERLERLPRRAMALQSMGASRALVFDGADSRKRMTDFANLYGPEHLILSVRKPWEIAEGIRSAGSVFMGNWSPESAGDYASGTNHTLPTGGWSRAFGGVNTDSFMRKITYQELSPSGLAAISQTIVTMALAEGLDAHAEAVKVRMAAAKEEIQ